MKRKKYTYPIIFVLLVVVYLLAHHWFVRVRENGLKLIPYEKEQITLITISKNMKPRVILSRQNSNTFMFETPFSGISASNKIMAVILNSLTNSKIKKSFEVTDLKEATKYGITQNSPHLELSTKNDSISYILGTNSPLKDAVYLYDNTKNRIIMTHPIVRTIILAGPERFREQSLLEMDINSVVSFNFILDKNKQLYFNKTNEYWYYRKNSSMNRTLCNQTIVKDLLLNIQELRVDDFTSRDEQWSLKKCGLETPNAVFTIQSATGAPQSISFGDENENNLIYASVNESIRGAIQPNVLKLLSRPATTYAISSVIDFHIAAVSQFTTQGEVMVYTYDKIRGHWYRTGEKQRKTDDQKVITFLLSLKKIVVDKFFFDTELGDITKEYIFFSRDGSVLSHIQIGERSGDYFKTKFNNRDTIFGLSRYAVEKLEI